MADIFSEKSSYLKEPSLASLIKSRVTISPRWLDLVLPAALFLVALLPRILHLGAFMTADEDDQIMFSTYFLKSVLKGDWTGALILGYPGVPTSILGALGVGARYLVHYLGWLPLPWLKADFYTTLEQLTTRFGYFEHPFDFLLWARAPLALAASLSIVAIYQLTRRLLDERLALFSALILAFDPFFLAHSRVIHVDAPLAYFMFLSFLAFLLYLEKGAWKWLLLSGLCGGLAGLSKIPAGLLGPILVVSGALYALFPPPEAAGSIRWKRLAIALTVWGLIALAAIFALWPTMWSRPLFAVESLSRNLYNISGAHDTTGIFWGGQQSDQSPWYYLIAFPYHLTPLTTVGLVAGVALIVAGLVGRWRNQAQGWSSRVLPLVLSLVAYGVLFVAPLSAISKRGDRYILPVFLAVGLLSTLALWWLANLLVKYVPGLTSRFRIGPTRLVGGVILAQVFFILLYHPYYLAYFNPIVNTYQPAPTVINVGWGEGLDLAAQYLNELEQDGDEPPLVAAWYSTQFAPYYRGRTIDLSSQETALTADYTVFYINQVQRGFPSGEVLNYFRQREPLHVVKLGGIEYAWIYKGPVIGQNAQSDYSFPVEALLGGAARLYGVHVAAVETPADTFAVSEQVAETEPYLGYGQVKPGLPVTLFWETLGHIETNHGKTNIYIRLVDEHGNIWGSVDRIILAGLWRTNRWHPNYFLRDEYKLPIDPATPPGTYQLEIGLYDFETGQSLGVVKEVGQITLAPSTRLVTAGQLKLSQLVSQPIDDSLKLVGHTYINNELPPGGEVFGKIFWQANQSIEREYALEFSFLGPERKKYIIAEQQLSEAYPPTTWRRNEIAAEAYRFRIPAAAPAGEYPLMVTVVDPQTGESIGQPVTLATIKVEMLERNFDLPENVTPISAVLNDEIELVGYRLDEWTAKRRETFGLTLYWRSLKFPSANYTVFVHAVGPDQVIRGQWDSPPVQGQVPTGGWLPGEVIEDHYEVLMGRDVPPWKYDIFVGMYDPVTGKRALVQSAKAPVSEDRVWLTRVQAVEE
jgi:hypothetical protein